MTRPGILSERFLRACPRWALVCLAFAFGGLFFVGVLLYGVRLRGRLYFPCYCGRPRCSGWMDATALLFEGWGGEKP